MENTLASFVNDLDEWKPKKGETYFTFVLMDDKWGVGSLHWDGFPNEYALLDKGWVYRTRAEAQAALPAAAKEIGVEYKIKRENCNMLQKSLVKVVHGDRKSLEKV